MAILTDLEIIKAVERGDIFISNFNPVREYDGKGKYRGRLGANSYDTTLNEKLLVYDDFPLDMKKNNTYKEVIIPPEGYILQPGVLYLGRINEYTKTNNYVPVLEGRSSTARLGMSVDQTANFGDVGYEGYWTLEISVIHPLRVYPNVSICQITYHTIEGKVRAKYNGKYQGANEIKSSKMYKDEIFNNKDNVEYIGKYARKVPVNPLCLTDTWRPKFMNHDGNFIDIINNDEFGGAGHPASSKELSIIYKAFPTHSKYINEIAKQMLDWLNQNQDNNSNKEDNTIHANERFAFESGGMNKDFFKKHMDDDVSIKREKIKENLYNNKIEKYKAYGVTKFVVKELLSGIPFTLDISEITYNNIEILITLNNNYIVQLPDNIFVELNTLLSVMSE